jgi:cytochrome c5
MKSKLNWLSGVIFSIACATVTLLASGCSTTGTQAPAGTASAKQPLAAPAGMAKVSGAQLWAQNCGHCHNIRTPTFYSDAQWEVVVLHMRVRANLTADEHKQILAFLKSAH